MKGKGDLTTGMVADTFLDALMGQFALKLTKLIKNLLELKDEIKFGSHYPIIMSL